MEDTLQSQIQPQFPPQYTNDNNHAIDWGYNGLIAYASGACIHLSHHVNNKLEHVGSIEVNPFQLSCVKFHPNQPIIAIGDIKGRVFLWDIENSQFIASAKPLKKGADRCLALQWYENVLLVLLNSRKLIAVSHNKGYNTDILRNFKILWEITLPNDYTRMSIDTYMQNNLLISGKDSFIIYHFEAAFEPPKLIHDDISFSNSMLIKDVQWSIHFPNFLFILTNNSIYLFNTENSCIVSAVESNPDSFSFLVQLPSDHTRLLTISFGGGISIFLISEKLTYRSVFDVLPKMSCGMFVSVIISPIKDDYICLFHSVMGLSLFDMKTMTIRSIDFTFPSKITSFDSDATRYVVGTNEGFIIIGSLFDNSETKRFKVSDDSILFVSYDAPLFRVYWQTAKTVGIVDVASRTINRYKSSNDDESSNDKKVRCFGSHRGGFILLHDGNIVGIFVDGKEKRLVFDDAVADIFIDPESTQTSGSFSVLLERHTILFYKYNSTKVFCESQGITPRGLQAKALCFAKNSDGDEYVTGFSNGLLFFYCPSNKMIKRVSLECLNLRSLQFGADNNSLFGLCKDDSLFMVNRIDLRDNSKSAKSNAGFFGKVMALKDQVRFCGFGVFAYKVINESLLLVHAFDGIVKFVRISDWTPLSYISKFMPAPTSDMELSYFVTHQKEEVFFSKIAKDAWLCAKEEYPMRLHSFYGIHKPSRISAKGDVSSDSLDGIKDLSFDCVFENFLYEFNNRVEKPDFQLVKSKIVSLLFLNRYSEASDLLMELSSADLEIFRQSSLRLSDSSLASTFSGFSKSFKNSNSATSSHTQSATTISIDSDQSADSSENSVQTVKRNFFNASILSTLILLAEEDLCEQTKVHIKMSAMSLISQGRYEDAMLLLRLGKFDKEAAEYLIDSSQISLATKFIRNTVNDNDKLDLLFKCGCKFFELGKLDNAIPYFAGAGQYHAVLFVLLSKGKVVDAYFLMKFLTEKGKLRQLDERLIKFFPDLQSLDTICEMINSQFNDLVKKLNVNL